VRQAWLVLLLPGCWACAGAFVAAGPTADVGTLGVGGMQGGVGGQLEIGMLFRQRERSTLGAALTGSLAGYSTAADADPLFFTGLELRFRRWYGAGTRSTRPFVEVGGGPVVAWAAGPQAGGVVAHLGAGLQGGGPEPRWWVALRARPAGLAGGQAEFFASTQIVFGLALGS
jgi:hypothetical protein